MNASVLSLATDRSKGVVGFTSGYDSSLEWVCVGGLRQVDCQMFWLDILDSASGHLI